MSPVPFTSSLCVPRQILAKLCEILHTDSLAEVLQWLVHASNKGEVKRSFAGTDQGLSSDIEGDDECAKLKLPTWGLQINSAKLFAQSSLPESPVSLYTYLHACWPFR